MPPKSPPSSHNFTDSQLVRLKERLQEYNRANVKSRNGIGLVLMQEFLPTIPGGKAPSKEERQLLFEAILAWYEPQVDNKRRQTVHVKLGRELTYNARRVAQVMHREEMMQDVNSVGDYQNKFNPWWKALSKEQHQNYTKIAAQWNEVGPNEAERRRLAKRAAPGIIKSFLKTMASHMGMHILLLEVHQGENGVPMWSEYETERGTEGGSFRHYFEGYNDSDLLTEWQQFATDLFNDRMPEPVPPKVKTEDALAFEIDDEGTPVLLASSVIDSAHSDPLQKWVRQFVTWVYLRCSKGTQVEVPWQLLQARSDEMIPSQCMPEEFEWKDPSKITLGEARRLVHHWKRRARMGKTPLYFKEFVDTRGSWHTAVRLEEGIRRVDGEEIDRESVQAPGPAGRRDNGKKGKKKANPREGENAGGGKDAGPSRGGRGKAATAEDTASEALAAPVPPPKRSVEGRPQPQPVRGVHGSPLVGRNDRRAYLLSLCSLKDYTAAVEAIWFETEHAGIGSFHDAETWASWMYPLAHLPGELHKHKAKYSSAMKWLQSAPYFQADDVIHTQLAELTLMIIGQFIRDISHIQMAQHDPDDPVDIPAALQASVSKFSDIDDYLLPLCRDMVWYLSGVEDQEGDEDGSSTAAPTAPPRMHSETSRAVAAAPVMVAQRVNTDDQGSDDSDKDPEYKYDEEEEDEEDSGSDDVPEESPARPVVPKPTKAPKAALTAKAAPKAKAAPRAKAAPMAKAAPIAEMRKVADAAAPLKAAKVAPPPKAPKAYQTPAPMTPPRVQATGVIPTSGVGEDGHSSPTDELAVEQVLSPTPSPLMRQNPDRKPGKAIGTNRRAAPVDGTGTADVDHGLDDAVDQGSKPSKTRRGRKGPVQGKSQASASIQPAPNTTGVMPPSRSQLGKRAREAELETQVDIPPKRQGKRAKPVALDTEQGEATTAQAPRSVSASRLAVATPAFSGIKTRSRTKQPTGQGGDETRVGGDGNEAVDIAVGKVDNIELHPVAPQGMRNKGGKRKGRKL